MNETIAILTHAYTLIKKGWTRKYFAINKHGKGVDWSDEQACRFCLTGGIRRATYNLFPKESKQKQFIIANDATYQVSKYVTDLGYKSTISFNDSSTKAEVLNAIKQVINAVKS